MNKELEFSTKAAIRYEIKGPVNPVATPIYTTSTYVLENAEHGALLSELKKPLKGQSPWLYCRWGNPTNDVVVQAITSLEEGYGSYVLCSGMAAISTTLMTFLQSGDHVIAPYVVYGGTHEVLNNFFSKFGIEVTWVDSKNIENYESAIKSNTKLLYGETPANPTMQILDLEHFSKIGKKYNLITIIDSTFASPYVQKPLRYGIDIVIHSATKYLGGHSDLCAGTITCLKKEHFKKIYQSVKLLGNTLSSFDSFLLARGIKTLDVRMERHCKNALEIAKFLELHPKVKKVYYPGLPSHPQHEIAIKQMNGFGGMIAFDVGNQESGKKVIENVKLITLAVSLGGVESLIEHAASMTHTMVDKEKRIKGGITDGLIRLSVGIEDYKDLISDLQQALDKI